MIAADPRPSLRRIAVRLLDAAICVTCFYFLIDGIVRSRQGVPRARTVAGSEPSPLNSSTGDASSIDAEVSVSNTAKLFAVEPQSGTRILMRSSGANKEEIIFEHGPGRLRSLSQGPDRREPELNQGLWVILVFAIWSVGDCACISEAVRFAYETNESLSVGVRPMFGPREIRTWCPEFDTQQNGHVTPQWILLRDGKLLATDVRLLKAKEIGDFVRRALDRDRSIPTAE